MWKEKVRFIGNGSCASIDIRIDFDQFVGVRDEEKVNITWGAIIRAGEKVKTKGKFDYEMFCQDLQNVTEN